MVVVDIAVAVVVDAVPRHLVHIGPERRRQFRMAEVHPGIYHGYGHGVARAALQIPCLRSTDLRHSPLFREDFVGRRVGEMAQIVGLGVSDLREGLELFSRGFHALIRADAQQRNVPLLAPVIDEGLEPAFALYARTSFSRRSRLESDNHFIRTEKLGGGPAG